MTQSIHELAIALSAIYSPTAGKISSLPGPHLWKEMTCADFGPEHDFELENHQTQVIFTPISKAALHWCYAHLPQDMPRHGKSGFFIEAAHIKGVVGGARRDGLMSPEDYAEAMEENSQLITQGEQQ